MLRKLRFFIRKYMGFSQTEANGFIILIPLMVLMVLGPSIYRQILIRTSPPDNSKDIELLQEWMAEIESNIKTSPEEEFIPENFNFDPNTSSKQELKRLGFSATTAQRISKYRDAGGKFYKKEDLLKIYGISKERTQQLWKHIKIPKSKKKKRTYETNESKKLAAQTPKRLIVKQPFNLASVDTIRKIRGIGPVLSKRIIKYRNRLGGFIHKEQLNEVYGLKPEVQEKIWEYFTLDSMNVHPIHVNTSPDSTLWQHPYLSYNQAKAIVAYRNQHGPFHKVENLRSIKILSDSTVQKISPYLKLE